MASTSGGREAQAGNRRIGRALRIARQRYSWAILGTLLFGALVVAAAWSEGGIFERIEKALLLLPVANRTDTSGLPTPVRVAYLVAVVVILIATYRAVVALMGERAHEIRARLRRRHTVVAGLGSQGQTLSESLLRSTKVVAVEIDRANPAVRRLRDAGAVVLIGDATDPELLRRAGVRRARHVVSVCGDDAVNARMAASLLDVAGRDRKAAFDAFVHVSDPRLYTFLLHHSFAARGSRLEFFNIYAEGARGLLDEALRVLRGTVDSVLVVGAGHLGLAVLSLLARDRYELLAREPQRGKVRAHIVDLDAQARAQILADRYSRLLDACDLVPHDLDVASPAYDRLLAANPALADSAVAFVCFDNDTLTISATLSLLDQAQGRLPVLARVSERSEGIAGMIERAHSRYADAGVFRPITLAERGSPANRVLEGVRGQLARQVHDTYRSENPGGPYDVPWTDLSSEGRERSRRHADAIVGQLESVGYALGPLIDWGDVVPLTPVEIERMSRLEHERWQAERVAEGWRQGPTRDDAARLHPDLVSWERLPEPRRDITRRLVAARPSLLSRMGIQIERGSPDLADGLAQAMHESYVHQRVAAGEEAGSTPSLTAWESLPEEFRNSSRTSAGALLSAVRSLGYDVTLRSDNDEGGSLSVAQIDDIAERLHQQWVEERMGSGWVGGSQRSDERRIHPDLVDWEELRDERREIDRNLARELPGLLSSLGFVLVQRPERPVSPDVDASRA